MSAREPAVTRALARTMTRTIAQYELLRPGSRVLVALSGGKDSYTLFDLLDRARRHAPFRFEMIGVHVDQGQPGYDGTPLESWLTERGLPFEVVHDPTYETVIEKTPPGKAYCAVCSRLRRGILYSTAERLGCTAIALGHHADDALETLLLNLFHAGSLQAMPAKYTTDDGRFEVIRPLIECAEKDIIEHAIAFAYPILPCNLCGSQEGLQRDAMADLIKAMEINYPHVRANMLNALRNVHPTHLLDRAVAAAWAARPADPPRLQLIRR